MAVSNNIGCFQFMKKVTAGCCSHSDLGLSFEKANQFLKDLSGNVGVQNYIRCLFGAKIVLRYSSLCESGLESVIS